MEAVVEISDVTIYGDILWFERNETTDSKVLQLYNLAHQTFGVKMKDAEFAQDLNWLIGGPKSSISSRKTGEELLSINHEAPNA